MVSKERSAKWSHTFTATSVSTNFCNFFIAFRFFSSKMGKNPLSIFVWNDTEIRRLCGLHIGTAIDKYLSFQHSMYFCWVFHGFKCSSFAFYVLFGFSGINFSLCFFSLRSEIIEALWGKDHIRSSRLHKLVISIVGSFWMGEGYTHAGADPIDDRGRGLITNFSLS